MINAMISDLTDGRRRHTTTPTSGQLAERGGASWELAGGSSCQLVRVATSCQLARSHRRGPRIFCAGCQLAPRSRLGASWGLFGMGAS